MVAVTATATVVFAHGASVFTPWRLTADVPDVFAELLASPPTDGFAAPDEGLRAHAAHPRIREYLLQHYIEREGNGGPTDRQQASADW
jgi:hypothetical protein